MIRSIDDFHLENLHKLVVLSLNKNDLTYLPGIFWEMNLSELYLDDNNLNEIDPRIENFEKLKIISIRGMKFYTLPLSIIKLTSLEYFYYEEDDISNLDRKLEEFLKEYKEEQNPVFVEGWESCDEEEEEE